MKRNLKGLIPIMILIGIIGSVLAINPVHDAIYQFKEYERHESPSGKYILIIYKASREPFNTGMTSSYWDRQCYVKLTDKDGKTIVKPFPILSCTFSLGRLEIEWLENKNIVYFTKTEFIRIDEKRCACGI